MPQKDPEARREYMRQWREKNREKARENQRRYHENNRDKVREYHQRYYQENREQILERDRQHRAAPEVRDKKRARARRYAVENPEKVRENRRRHWAKKKYGLTLEAYEAILARGCAICGLQEDPDRGERRKGRLCLDHDHANGQIRDALCNPCNTGLGSFTDDPARLRAAAKYLEGHAKHPDNSRGAR